MFSGIWGMAGALIVSVLLCLTRLRLDVPGDIGIVWLCGAVYNALLSGLELYAAESLIGFCYGASRAMIGPVHLKRGVILGVATWTAIGSPLFFVGIGMALFASALPHGGPPFIELFVPILLYYLGHVAAGAIAGFQVEYYLLHTPRDAS
jgi:hypothetical protein